MIDILKFQVGLIVILIWMLGSAGPVIDALFNGNKLAGLFGAVFFFVFMYPVVFILKKLLPRSETKS